MTSHDSEQDIDFILQNDLLNLINPKTDINYWSLIAGRTPKQERLFFGLIMFYMIFLISLVGLVEKTEKTPESNFGLAILTIISFVSTIILFLLWQRSRLSRPQSAKDVTRQQLRKLKSKSIDETRMIDQWVEKASIQQLKAYQLVCERLLLETQTHERAVANLSPFFALLFIIVPIFILGIPIQLPENSLVNQLFKSRAIGVPGLVALITIILNYINAHTAKLRIDRIAQCIALLKEAQDMIGSHT